MDLEKNGRLTNDYPKLGVCILRARNETAGRPVFPVQAKLDHFILEKKFFVDNAHHARIVGIE